jgi:hypothetical protein
MPTPRRLIVARAVYLGALLGSMRCVKYADRARTQDPSCPARAAVLAGGGSC